MQQTGNRLLVLSCRLHLIVPNTQYQAGKVEYLCANGRLIRQIIFHSGDNTHSFYVRGIPIPVADTELPL